MLAAQCKGVTDYQLPISTALREFEKVRGQGRGNQHILFLTDGLPTAGDRNLVREMELARRLGCCIHTVFIGMQTFPAILERMSQHQEQNPDVDMGEIPKAPATGPPPDVGAPAAAKEAKSRTCVIL